MIIHSDHSIFGISETEKTDLLVNPANTVGVMGAGLALEFKLRYPKYYEDYHRKALQNVFNIGDLHLYNENDHHIATIFTKKHWKYPSKMEWVKAAFDALNKYLQKNNGITVAMPLAGAGKGGLSKEEVIHEIEKSFKNTISQIIICHDKIPSANETAAIEKIYSTEPYNIENKTIEQPLKIIHQHQKPQRFRDLNRIKGIGKTAYQQLFLTYMTPSKPQKNPIKKGEQGILF